MNIDFLHDLIIPGAVFIGLGALMGILLAFATKMFHVETDERVEAITACLPGANCGGCGYAGCSALAEAIVAGEAPVGSCSVSSPENIDKIAAIMGVEAGAHIRMRAQVTCSGANSNTKKRYIYSGADDCVAASKIGGGNKECPYGCIGLGTCEAHCPFGAIKVENGLAKVDNAKCRGCGVCVSFCPKNVIRLIPFESKVWIGCSSKDTGKTVKGYCDAGCLSCKICEKNCPSGAIKLDGNSPYIDYEKCTGCGICADKCPRKIIFKI